MSTSVILDTADRVELDVATIRAYVRSIDLRSLRGDRSQEEIAECAGVSQCVISRVEKGEQDRMTVFTLIRVLRVYLGESYGQQSEAVAQSQ